MDDQEIKNKILENIITMSEKIKMTTSKSNANYILISHEIAKQIIGPTYILDLIDEYSKNK